MRLKRDIWLFGAVAVAALAGGGWLLANRPGAAIEAFQRTYRQQAEAAKPRLPPAGAFRATVCAASPCVVVEAGGLTFLFGAGKAAAEGVARLGLMHPSIDAVLLPDLAVGVVEGLPAIVEAGARAGRREPLKVFGPAGLLPVVDGANLLASGAPQARLAAGIEGEDQGGYGRVVFDSGVVLIRGFGGAERGMGRVYRIDFQGRSLILAGCTAQPSDIRAAAREASGPAAILTAGSERLRGSPSRCIDLPAVADAISQARITASLVIPGDPASDLPWAADAWREALGNSALSGPRLGLPGAVLDLSQSAAQSGESEQK